MFWNLEHTDDPPPVAIIRRQKSFDEDKNVHPIAQVLCRVADLAPGIRRQRDPVV
jgi:hypothetical protein